MKKYIICFIIIFLFFLPTSAVSSSQPEVRFTGLQNILDHLNTKDKKIYREFCNKIIEYHVELNRIFMKQPTGAREKWQAVCQSARSDIQNTRYLVTKAPKGSDDRAVGAIWFKGLMSLFNLYDTKGLSALNSFMYITDSTEGTKINIKDNEITKKEFRHDISFYIDGYVGIIESFEQADSKMDWIYYSDKKSRPRLDQDYESLKILASNTNEAIKFFRKRASAVLLFKGLTGDAYARGLKNLKNWEIKDFTFSGLEKSRLSWQKELTKKYEEYKKVNAIWLKGIEFSKKDNNTLFKDTKYLKNWRWRNVQGSAIVSRYKPTIDTYKNLKKYKP